MHVAKTKRNTFVFQATRPSIAKCCYCNGLQKACTEPNKNVTGVTEFDGLILFDYIIEEGVAVAQWLRYCATNR